MSAKSSGYMSARLFDDGFYVLVVTFPADIAEIGLLERLIEPDSR